MGILRFFYSFTFFFLFLNSAWAVEYQAIEYRCSNGQNYSVIANTQAITDWDGRQVYRQQYFCNSSHIPDRFSITDQAIQNCNGDNDSQTAICGSEFVENGNLSFLNGGEAHVVAAENIKHGRAESAQNKSQFEEADIPFSIWETKEEQIQANCLQVAKTFLGVESSATQITRQQFHGLYAVATRPGAPAEGFEFDGTACSELIRTEAQAWRATIGSQNDGTVALPTFNLVTED